MYRSSLHRAASSTSSSETAENPRTVASVPGSPTIRDPFGNSSEISLSPSPFGRIPSSRANPVAFRRNSPLCRPLGLTTTVRLPAVWVASWMAFAAVIVDFPHCRLQFKIPRLLAVKSTRACKASTGSPNRVRTHSAASTPSLPAAAPPSSASSPTSLPPSSSPPPDNPLPTPHQSHAFSCPIFLFFNHLRTIPPNSNVRVTLPLLTFHLFFCATVPWSSLSGCH